MSIADFNPKYVTPILKKLNGEEKFGFLIGNFNSNLMKINGESGNSQFCNAMCSYFFTPLLLQPTMIPDKSKTLIHNIFFNSFEFTILSGNITHSISDHLIQFVILEDFITQKPLEVVYVRTGNPAFCLFLYLTGVYFRGELQHVGDVSEQKIKC